MIKTYRRGEQISPNFKADEFICKCTTCQARGEAYVDDKFIAKLQAFRVKMGKPIVVTSGNRCLARNRALGNTTEDSRHLSWDIKYEKLLHCDGADIKIVGIVPDDLVVLAEAFGFDGLGVYDAKNDYIHVDTRGIHTCWWRKTSGSNTPGFGGIPCVFKSGQRSPAITKIQQALGLKPDGKGTMDAATVNALKKYQTDNYLVADGVYGISTNSKLKVFNW